MQNLKTFLERRKYKSPKSALSDAKKGKLILSKENIFILNHYEDFQVPVSKLELECVMKLLRSVFDIVDKETAIDVTFSGAFVGVMVEDPKILKKAAKVMTEIKFIDHVIDEEFGMFKGAYIAPYKDRILYRIITLTS